MKASAREMSVAALPIAATRDRNQNWNQRCCLEKSPAQAIAKLPLAIPTKI
jgi:hypothetical protein